MKGFRQWNWVAGVVSRSGRASSFDRLVFLVSIRILKLLKLKAPLNNPTIPAFVTSLSHSATHSLPTTLNLLQSSLETKIPIRW
ncbi:hypothetical protein SLE2022_225180 [Rubroshorea leprosula]